MRLPILVVDDEEFIRNIVPDILRSMGFEEDDIYIGNDKEDGLRLLNSLLPTIESNSVVSMIVISDLRMPNPEGHELINEVQKASNKIATILMSGTMGDVEANLCNPDFRLEKPFGVKELRSAVIEALLNRADEVLKKAVGD